MYRPIRPDIIANIKNVSDKDSYLFRSQVSIDNSYIVINVAAK